MCARLRSLSLTFLHKIELVYRENPSLANALMIMSEESRTDC